MVLDLARDSLEALHHGGSDVLVWDYFVASVSTVRKKAKARWWSHKNSVNLASVHSLRDPVIFHLSGLLNLP